MNHSWEDLLISWRFPDRMSTACCIYFHIIVLIHSAPRLRTESEVDSNWRSWVSFWKSSVGIVCYQLTQGARSSLISLRSIGLDVWRCFFDTVNPVIFSISGRRYKISKIGKKKFKRIQQCLSHSWMLFSLEKSVKENWRSFKSQKVCFSSLFLAEWGMSS